MVSFMNQLALSPEKVAEISGLAQRYLWWPSVDEGGHSLPRKIAQIMRLGTYEDVRRLEAILGEAVLVQVMAESQPGWFDDRSWDFWRGRLSVSGGREIPEQRPKRTFAHVSML